MFFSFFLLLSIQSNCSICQLIHNADEYSPPILPKQTEYEVTLQGEYVSTRCEVRQVYFITRHVIFHHNYTWEAYYHYYSDPDCQHTQYSMYVKGVHTMALHSTIVPGATNFDFKTTEMWITPQNRLQMELLNFAQLDGNCGTRNAWRINEPQDVTDTNGCTALGVQLPHTEYELMRMETDVKGRVLLFTGQRQTVASTPHVSELRSTSYQTPLIRCAGINPLISMSVTESGEGGAAFLSSNLCFVLFVMFLNLYFVQH